MNVPDSRPSHLRGLRRAEGQVRGLAGMVEDDAYCLDFLAQVSAATRTLQASSFELLNEHLAPCVLDAACAGGHPAEQRLTDATEANACLVRS